MADHETVTNSDSGAGDWVGRWMQSDVLAATGGDAATRSLQGSASTGLKTAELGVGPVRFGQYELIERLGQGGMGTVYRVRNLELDRHEAMKLIARNPDDSDARSRFEREFLSLAKIEHPHIVPVYAAGNWEGVPYFTMKYVPGGALSKHLDRFRMDPVAAARLMAKVARAVGKLHSSGVLHRDLKPHNILLGDDDEPLVADFGLVKKLGEDSDASMTGFPMGTRQYMSPEQTFAHRADYTPACDIWAVGVILYELLAGERPFPSTDPVEVYLQIRAADPRPVLDVNLAAPPSLAAVAHRCLAKKPSDRYQTAAAVADDLEAWLAGDEVTATLPPPKRAPRPHWPGWVAAACAAVAVLAWAATRPAAQTTTEATARPLVPAVAAAEPPPAPVPVRSAFERLMAGETVTLIGPKGLPLRPWRQLPGSTAAITATSTDTCLMQGREYSAVELLNEPLPYPVVVSAEIDLAAYHNTSWGGVFAGGAFWDSHLTKYHAAPAAVIMLKSVPVGQDNVITTRGSADVVAWPDARPPNSLTIGGFVPTTTRRARNAPEAQTWQPVHLIVRADGVDVSVAGQPARTIDWAEKVAGKPGVLFGPPPPGTAHAPPPTPGNAIGLVAAQTELFVRNLIVTKPGPRP